MAPKRKSKATGKAWSNHAGRGLSSHCKMQTMLSHGSGSQLVLRQHSLTFSVGSGSPSSLNGRLEPLEPLHHHRARCLRGRTLRRRMRLRLRQFSLCFLLLSFPLLRILVSSSILRLRLLALSPLLLLRLLLLLLLLFLLLLLSLLLLLLLLLSLRLCLRLRQRLCLMLCARVRLCARRLARHLAVGAAAAQSLCMKSLRRWCGGRLCHFSAHSCRTMRVSAACVVLGLAFFLLLARLLKIGLGSARSSARTTGDGTNAMVDCS